MIDPTRIKGYHAHIYYDALSRPRAAELREAVERQFDIRMGRWHDVPVGRIRARCIRSRSKMTSFPPWRRS
jgi:DOPA 4,5-dioxygenase